MSAVASRITGLMIVYSSLFSDADQRKHRIFASLAFVSGIPRWQVNSPHKGPVTLKMSPFNDVIMNLESIANIDLYTSDSNSVMRIPKSPTPSYLTIFSFVPRNFTIICAQVLSMFEQGLSQSKKIFFSHIYIYQVIPHKLRPCPDTNSKWCLIWITKHWTPFFAMSHLNQLFVVWAARVGIGADETLPMSTITPAKNLKCRGHICIAILCRGFY